MQRRRPLPDILQELNKWRIASGRSHREIATRAGVNLSTVYRVFNAQSATLRYGAGLRRICELANVAIDEVTDGRLPAEIRRAALDCWNGTPEHAIRIAKAIRALGELLR
jgi:hypothetical protein